MRSRRSAFDLRLPRLGGLELLCVGVIAVLGLWVTSRRLPLFAASPTVNPAPTPAAAVPGVTADFAYYPSHHSARVRIAYARLPGRAAVTSITARVLRRTTGEVLAEMRLPATADFVSERSWQLPVLGEGEYEMVAQLEGASIAPLRVPFVRHHFEWEGNALGRSDIVVPPYTPIKVTEESVGVILREHRIDGLGLWRQVTSLGRELFTRPMRLELRRNGQTEVVTGTSRRFVTSSGTRVVTESAFPGGTARAEWDYDGAMQWTLTLEATPQPVDSLTLVVSLADRLTPLMHAATDGIRINYAGAVPAGSGRIWDGRQAKRRSIVGTFVPYLWLGAEERGLAVFAENDRGWTHAGAAPAQELRRVGDTLELRLNLIAERTLLSEARRIALGFQATPTKPMPVDWRLWLLGSSAPRGDTAPHFAFLGSNWTWGALTPAMDVYPRDEDFTLWDAFKRVRESGKAEPEVLNAWVKPLTDPAELERTRREVGYAFNVLRGQPRDVLVYTNPRGFRGDTREGQTFLNEWHRQTFPKRVYRVGEGPAYDVNPTGSFRDYAVWHYAKMLRTFATSIYWDDTFLQSVFNPTTTSAFPLPDGRIQPAAGLWDMRELIRRTAILDLELGREPRNMAHMTNAAISPILSFSQMNYSWEDQRGGGDYQDRYPRDYVRAESIGRQHGTVPFAVYLFPASDHPSYLRIRRSAVGVALVHEIKFNWSEMAWRAAYQRLLNFGYGREGVEVFNYWQETNPASVIGTDAATLCLSKPGSALVVVTDYGEGGQVQLALDSAKLALPRGLKARDVETGEALTIADGKVRFELKRHDYRMIEVTAE